MILNGVTFTTTADRSGNWSVDTETATPTAGGPFTALTSEPMMLQLQAQMQEAIAQAKARAVS